PTHVSPTTKTQHDQSPIDVPYDQATLTASNTVPMFQIFLSQLLILNFSIHEVSDAVDQALEWLFVKHRLQEHAMHDQLQLILPMKLILEQFMELVIYDGFNDWDYQVEQDQEQQDDQEDDEVYGVKLVWFGDEEYEEDDEPVIIVEVGVCIIPEILSFCGVIGVFQSESFRALSSAFRAYDFCGVDERFQLRSGVALSVKAVLESADLDALGRFDQFYIFNFELDF
ncbi:MAG: hypothetical protein EZS28_013164, partial [Streblomastix strix]